MAEQKSSEVPKEPDPKAEETAKAKGNATSKASTEERMEGMQGWMAEIEKRQERTTRIGGVALLLAVLAAGGALALGIINKQDAATNEDVDDLTQQVNELGGSITDQTEKQLKGINQRLTSLERQLAGLNERARKAEADINALRRQQNAAAAQAAAQPAPDTSAGSGKQGSQNP